MNQNLFLSAEPVPTKEIHIFKKKMPKIILLLKLIINIKKKALTRRVV